MRSIVQKLEARSAVLATNGANLPTGCEWSKRPNFPFQKACRARQLSFLREQCRVVPSARPCFHRQLQRTLFLQEPKQFQFEILQGHRVLHDSIGKSIRPSPAPNQELGVFL